jgi:glutamine synthetase
VLDVELDALDAAGRKRFGVRELPRTQADALAAIESDETARGWFAPDLVATHLGIRRTEAAILAGLPSEEQCRRYADVV